MRPERDIVTGLEKIARHGSAHEAQSEESEFCHTEDCTHGLYSSAGNMSVESLFLQFSVEKLRQFVERIEACLGKLNEEQIWMRGGENENAIGNLALHLRGNVGQWILSSLGGDP